MALWVGFFSEHIADNDFFYSDDTKISIEYRQTHESK